MGAKISVDSATMMNKSLEIIEASYLFNLESDEIEVLIHPQSIVHSMVEYIDGSILSQMGAPDMRTPIAHTLAWPERIATTGDILNLSNNINLSFEPIDLNRFPAVKMARQVLQGGAGASTAFNAANEIAVAAFLSGQLKFSEIESVVGEVLQRVHIQPISTIQDVFSLDHDARRIASAVIAGVN
jgi:1-deoxy-D-xylulose-5-phosphate reductoisomerase